MSEIHQPKLNPYCNPRARCRRHWPLRQWKVNQRFSFLNKNVALHFYVALLHTDLWPSRQSGILCTEHTSENKPKKSRDVAEMSRCHEMIYVDAHWNTGNVSVKVSLESVLICGHRGANEMLGTPQVQQLTPQPTVVFRLSKPRPRSRRSAKCGLEDNAGWYYWKKLLVNITVSIRLPPFVCLSHHRRIIKRVIFL